MFGVVCRVCGEESGDRVLMGHGESLLAWALAFIESVAVWASTRRKPHTDVLKIHAHKVSPCPQNHKVERMVKGEVPFHNVSSCSKNRKVERMVKRVIPISQGFTMPLEPQSGTQGAGGGTMLTRFHCTLSPAKWGFSYCCISDMM